MTVYAPANWTEKTYSTNAWFDLVPEECIVNSLVICSTQMVAEVSVRLYSSTLSSVLCSIVVDFEIGAGDSFSLDLRSLVVGKGQRIQCKASEDDVQFVASGVTY